MANSLASNIRELRTGDCEELCGLICVCLKHIAGEGVLRLPAIALLFALGCDAGTPRSADVKPASHLSLVHDFGICRPNVQQGDDKRGQGKRRLKPEGSSG